MGSFTQAVVVAVTGIWELMAATVELAAVVVATYLSVQVQTPIQAWLVVQVEEVQEMLVEMVNKFLEIIQIQSQVLVALTLEAAVVLVSKIILEIYTVV
jgi:hypothetical protein